MKAIVQDRYGNPDDVLELREVEQPVAGDGEVLVRVEAAGVSIGVWHMVRGIPYMVRLFSGLRKAQGGFPGFDIAGRVVTVGTGVEDLREGDEVVGWTKGAYVELAAVKADQLVKRAESLSPVDAVSLGDSAITALVAVRDQGKVEKGQRVLVNGASGGVGAYAVQIARSLGAEVTGVTSGRNAEMVRSLGAQHVVDYRSEDFTEGARTYDVMLDLIGNHSLASCRRVIKAGGAYVLVGVADLGRWLGVGRQVRALLTTPFVRQRTRVFVALHNRDDLIAVHEMAAAGEITPVVQRSYPLDETPAALAEQGAGHVAGKLAVEIAS